jgi:hypothetical protein
VAIQGVGLHPELTKVVQHGIDSSGWPWRLCSCGSWVMERESDAADSVD